MTAISLSQPIAIEAGPGRPESVASRRSLLALTLAPGCAGRRISDEIHDQALAGLSGGSSLEADAVGLRGRSVLIATAAQLPSALAMLGLDGIARRMLLCTPDLNPAHLPAVMAEAEIDTIVSDGSLPLGGAQPGVEAVTCRSWLAPFAGPEPDRSTQTEWVLLTSGTTGQPKLVVHTLKSLVGPLEDGLGIAAGPTDRTKLVWSTFYDIRRYGGLTILLRALIGGGSMILSGNGEAAGDFLVRAGEAGVTHISGTPSHWRRALMSRSAGRMAPGYVRLSGEIADQAILDQLARAYPGAEVAHAFASTEAGVGFDVRDGRAGFPVAYIGRPGAAELRVEGGTLRIRSQRTAQRYLGDRTIPGSAGFVDTGDMVEQRGDRFHFIGRREGVINVGGQKIHPEEVEAVINGQPGVLMSRAWGRPSPITGAIVAADVVLAADAGGFAAVRAAIVAACRQTLPAYKVPATVRQVASLPINAAGKLARNDA